MRTSITPHVDSIALAILILLLTVSCRAVLPDESPEESPSTEASRSPAMLAPTASQTPEAAPRPQPLPLRTEDPLCEDSVCAFYPHSPTDSGVIVWYFRFDENCYKFIPEDNPYWPQNAWVGEPPTGSGSYWLIAGAYGLEKPPSQGALFGLPPDHGDPCDPLVFIAPLQDGPLEIVGTRDFRFLLRSVAHNVYIEFDLANSRFYQPYSGITPVPAEQATPPIQ